MAALPYADQSDADAATTVAGEATRYLVQRELAARWRLSERTLERWRWRKIGPPYIKLGGRIVYHLDDIVAYEDSHRQQADTFVPDVGDAP